MFGHLKAEDFTNLLEGATLPEKRRNHLRSCPRCLRKLESVDEIRAQIEAMRMESEEYIPEPDWSEFRSDVRDALLSRSVKRETAGLNGFRNLAWRPVLAWGVSLVLVCGLAFDLAWNHRAWNHRGTDSETATTATIENSSADTDLNLLAAMSDTDVFDDLVQLDANEARNLQKILDEMAQEGDQGVRQQ